MINLDIKKGDTILTGKWRNHKEVVKEIGEDEYGHPTINGKPILKIRIEKLMPEKKKNEAVDAKTTALINLLEKYTGKKVHLKESIDEITDFDRLSPGIKLKVGEVYSGRKIVEIKLGNRAASQSKYRIVYTNKSGGTTHEMDDWQFARNYAKGGFDYLTMLKNTLPYDFNYDKDRKEFWRKADPYSADEIIALKLRPWINNWNHEYEVTADVWYNTQRREIIVKLKEPNL